MYVCVYKVVFLKYTDSHISNMVIVDSLSKGGYGVLIAQTYLHVFSSVHASPHRFPLHVKFLDK